jgi:hypothetical protein
MSLASVEAALAQAAAQIQPGQSHYRSLFDHDGVTPKRFLPDWLIGSVRHEIENTAELRNLASRFIQTPSSGGQLSEWGIAQSAIHRLFARVEPHQITIDLANLADTTICETCTCIGLYGGGISNEITLGENVAVAPAGMAPATLARELIFGINRWGRPITDPITEMRLPRLYPTIALLISEEMPIFSASLEINTVPHSSIAERSQQAIRALTLAGGFPFIRSWQMSWVVHPAVPYEGFGSWGAGGPLGAAPPRRPGGHPVIPELAQGMYSKLISLNAQIKHAVELAADRLGRSRCHPLPADTALDLGIASEIILLHGTKGSELRYRFALRGAYLLGKDGADRAKKFADFRSLYDARSNAAHTGTLEPKMQARLQEFDSLCAAAVRSIVEKQAFPDWEKLTLSAD